MRQFFNETETYGNSFWLCAKLCLMCLWMGTLIGMIMNGSTCPFPAGICKFYDFNVLFEGTGRILLLITILLLAIAYLLDIKMVWVTGLMFFISMVVISHRESSGIFDRATLYSTIFGAQFVAYCRYAFNGNFNIRFYRVQYSIQIIAATYVLSGISKLHDSGLHWASGGGLYCLQVVKGGAFAYYTDGNIIWLQQAYEQAYSLMQHNDITRLMLSMSLILEITCFLAAYNYRLRLLYGIALFFMHLGIAWLMNILIIPVAGPMLIFFLNPLYLLLRILRQ